MIDADPTSFSVIAMAEQDENPLAPPMIEAPPGRVAQWESARLTRERSLVRTQPRP